MENKSKQEAKPQSDSIEEGPPLLVLDHVVAGVNKVLLKDCNKLVYHTADINVDKYQAQSPSKPKLLIKEDILK